MTLTLTTDFVLDVCRGHEIDHVGMANAQKHISFTTISYVSLHQEVILI
jgi:hypothetical protein